MENLGSVVEQDEEQELQEKPPKKQNAFLRALGFDLVAKKTSIRTEIMAGVVTFLAMAYILTVNPDQIVGEGSAYWPSVFIATALGAIVGTLLMAFFAKVPLAQASGMGLNSMLGGMLGISAIEAYGGRFTPGQGFMLVLISGLLFLLLSFIKIKGKTFRELVFDGMPVSVRGAISVGIGLFISFIGFQKAKVITDSPFTLVELIQFSAYDFNVKNAVVCLTGLFLIAVLDKLNVKGSVIIGILCASLVGIPFGVTDWKMLAGNEQISWKFWESFGNYFSADPKVSVFGSFLSVFKTGLIPDGVSVFTVIMLIITLSMMNMFDTMGTIVGCCGGNRVLSDENNKPHNYGKIMMSDAIATCTGAMLGTSTVSTFVESGAGVSAGGRTGLTSFTTACLFFLSMFALPLFAVIPSSASSSALIYVGVLMMKNNIKEVDFSDTINATSAFLTMSIMLLSYSITEGIGVGMISYTLMSIVFYVFKLIKAIIKKEEKPKWNVSVIAIVVSLLFAVYFFVPTTL